MGELCEGQVCDLDGSEPAYEEDVRYRFPAVLQDGRLASWLRHLACGHLGVLPDA